MKNLIIISLLSFVFFSCEKEIVAVEQNENVRTLEKSVFRASAPNELVGEETPPNSGIILYDCNPNPVDCGPWVIVKPKLSYFLQFTNSIDNSSIQEYFSSSDWEELFENFDSDLLTGLQNGGITISEVTADEENKRLFIVHYANQEANKTNCLLALPFDTNE